MQIKYADISFVTSNQTDWLDPANWNQSLKTKNSEKIIDCSGRVDFGNPIPHSERIPCRYDDVLFPSNTTFKVVANLEIETQINSLKIGDKTFDLQSFNEYVFSKSGKYLFNITNLINLKIDQLQCNDISGCSCGNDEIDILKLICEKLSIGCLPLQCNDPVRPIGHCCDICAAVIMLSHKRGFNLDLLKDLIDLFESKPEFSGAKSYLHKLVDDRIQIIIIDSDEKGVADRLANNLKDHLTEGKITNMY